VQTRHSKGKCACKRMQTLWPRCRTRDSVSQRGLPNLTADETPAAPMPSRNRNFRAATPRATRKFDSIHGPTRYSVRSLLCFDLLLRYRKGASNSVSFSRGAFAVPCPHPGRIADHRLNGLTFRPLAFTIPAFNPFDSPALYCIGRIVLAASLVTVQLTLDLSF